MLIYIYFVIGFKTLNINKFRAKIKLDNVMSINMFEKLGFQEVSWMTWPLVTKYFITI